MTLLMNGGCIDSSAFRQPRGFVATHYPTQGWIVAVAACALTGMGLLICGSEIWTHSKYSLIAGLLVELTALFLLSALKTVDIAAPRFSTSLSPSF